MVENSCTWCATAELDPISRFKHFCEHYGANYDLSCHIIASLVAIDSVLSDHIDHAFTLYIQDDDSILWMLNNLSDYSFEKNQFANALLGIDFSKLIYRFTCARKFLVTNTRTNQLRINSWGRYYWENELSCCYQHVYQKFYATFAEYYEQHKFEYTHLIQCLSSDISPNLAQRIQKLNKDLAVKLLS